MKKTERGHRYIASPLNNPMLNYGEYYMTFGEKLLYLLALMAAGGLAGQVFYGGLFRRDGVNTTATYISNAIVFVLVGGIAAKVFMPVINDMLKNRRKKKLSSQFRDFLDVLATSLSAGNTINDAFLGARGDLLHQYQENDYIIRELTEIGSGIQNGVSLEIMLKNFGDRSADEDIENFSNVIGNCYKLGGNFKDVVRKTKDIINDKMAIADEIETKLASNKMQLNAMSLMPVVLVGMLKLASASFAENLRSFVGVAVTTIAVAMFVGAYFWGRKIIDIK